MLTARERAEQMADRIAYAGQCFDDRLRFYVEFEPQNGSRVMWLSDGGIPHRNPIRLVDFLEHYLDAHERERDHRAVPRGLLTANATGDSQPGTLSFELETRHGVAEMILGMGWLSFPGTYPIREAFDDIVAVAQLTDPEPEP